MFTGLVAELGKVTAITRGETSSVLTIQAPALTPELAIGDSIAVNGTCLTATSLTNDSFTADVMVQTLSLTSLGKLEEGLDSLDQVLQTATDEEPRDFEFIVDIETRMAKVMRDLGRNEEATEVERRLASVKDAMGSDAEAPSDTSL